MIELSKSVAHDMMVRIIEREFKENRTFPNEAELCAQYGVSRVVIREAKKKLQALGMVQSRKKTGSHINPEIHWNFFSRDLFDIYLEHSGRAREHMNDYFRLRLLIEPHLAAQVAASHSEEFAARLKGIVQDMADALDASDDDKWLRSDLSFHIMVYKESRNMLVLPLANLMQPLFLRGFSQVPAAWPASLVSHRKLCAAICEANSDEAYQITREIIIGGKDDYDSYTQD